MASSFLQDDTLHTPQSNFSFCPIIIPRPRPSIVLWQAHNKTAVVHRMCPGAYLVFKSHLAAWDETLLWYLSVLGSSPLCDEMLQFFHLKMGTAVLTK